MIKNEIKEEVTEIKKKLELLLIQAEIQTVALKAILELTPKTVPVTAKLKMSQDDRLFNILQDIKDLIAKIEHRDSFRK